MLISEPKTTKSPQAQCSNLKRFSSCYSQVVWLKEGITTTLVDLTTSLLWAQNWTPSFQVLVSGNLFSDWIHSFQVLVSGPEASIYRGKISEISWLSYSKNCMISRWNRKFRGQFRSRIVNFAVSIVAKITKFAVNFAIKMWILR